MNLQEKIKYAEGLVDTYLSEIGVDTINTALNTVNTVQGVSHDVMRLKDWAAKKIELRKKRKEKEKKIREKLKKEKQLKSKSRKKKGVFGTKIKW